MDRKTLIWIVVLGLVAIGGYLLFSQGSYKYGSSGSQAPGNIGEDTQEEIVTSDEGTQTQSLKEFTVEGSEYSFNLESISVDKGEKVRITFKNTGSISHNFGISLLGVRSRTISPGSSDTIEFIAEKTGTFNFDCSIPGHRGLGMEGQLIVT